jgi:LmbE family N-acetylglucosaminyl deacetylase
MAERRRREVTAALRELRVDPPVWLGFAEGRWDQTEARPSLEGLIARADVVYAPSVVDFHPEHRRVARLVASLVQPSQQVRVYEIGVPLTPLLVNLIADIQTVHLRKARALAHFASQSGALEPIERLARYRRSLYGLDRSEVFWELPAEAYARVTRLATRVDTSTFWGIRRRPVTDPLAFLVGTRARKELRSLAQ